MALRVGDDRYGSSLAACASRRGYANEWKPAIAEGHEAGEFANAFLVRRSHSHEFRGIDHGTATEGDDRVAAIGLESGQTFFAEFVGWIGQHFAENRVGNARVGKDSGEFANYSGFHEGGIGYYQRLLGVMDAQFGGNKLDAALSRQEGRNFLRYEGERSRRQIEPDPFRRMLHHSSLRRLARGASFRRPWINLSGSAGSRSCRYNCSREPEFHCDNSAHREFGDCRSGLPSSRESPRKTFPCHIPPNKWQYRNQWQDRRGIFSSRSIEGTSFGLAQGPRKPLRRLLPGKNRLPRWLPGIRPR